MPSYTKQSEIIFVEFGIYIGSNIYQKYDTKQCPDKRHRIC